MKNIEQELRAMMKRVRDELTRAWNETYIDEDGGAVTLMEYLTDALDVDFRVDREKQPMSCRVWLSLGGPDIWIDTEDKAVHGAWGNTRDSVPISCDLADAIDEDLTCDWDYY